MRAEDLSAFVPTTKPRPLLRGLALILSEPRPVLRGSAIASHLRMRTRGGSAIASHPRMRTRPGEGRSQTRRDEGRSHTREGEGWKGGGIAEKNRLILRCPPQAGLEGEAVACNRTNGILQ